jgi:hypothetical protein
MKSHFKLVTVVLTLLDLTREAPHSNPDPVIVICFMGFSSVQAKTCKVPPNRLRPPPSESQLTSHYRRHRVIRKMHRIRGDPTSNLGLGLQT